MDSWRRLLVGFFSLLVSLRRATLRMVFALPPSDIDASPAIGSPLAYDPTKEITSPISCRGVILLGAGKPIIFAGGLDRHRNESNVTLRKQLRALRTRRSKESSSILFINMMRRAVTMKRLCI